jgi:adenylate cyclase
MGAKLKIMSTDSEPYEVPIGNTATIGRTRENTFVLTSSPLVSRQHAIVRNNGSGQYQVIDLGSRNGTYVNDQRVIVPITLHDGARIQIADSVIVFSCEVVDDVSDDELVKTATMASLGAVMRPVALLVCDIRGFSSISEIVPGDELARMIGSWFRETGNLVATTGGTIDKFIGDAMLAYWGGGGSAAADCQAAYACARQIMPLADARTWPNGTPFRVAIALHFGEVVSSNVGVAAQRDATIIGDAVNTVFRLEGVSKELGQRILLSNDIVINLAERESFKDLGPQTLKGKNQTVRVYGLAT